MQRYLWIVIVVCYSTFVVGCLGVMEDAWIKSKRTDEITYADIAQTQVSNDSSGRIYIYRTENSTNRRLSYGVGIKKNSVFIAVDNEVYLMLWEVFMHKDLPLGVHEISCGNVIAKVESAWTKPVIHYQRGDQRLSLKVENDKDVYVRIDFIGEKPIPEVVDAAIAKQEIHNLPHLITEEPSGLINKKYKNK